MPRYASLADYTGAAQRASTVGAATGVRRRRGKAAKGAAYTRGPVGRIINSATAIAGDASSVRSLQTFLRNRGYSIDVDGIRGPQTNAALAAYHRGMKPTAFNGRDVVRRTTTAPRGAATVGRAAGPAPRGRVVRQAVTPQVKAINAKAVASGAAPAPVDMTDEQMAEQMIAAEFGPQRASLERAIAQTQAQAQAQAGFLGKLYGEIGQTATQAGQLTQASNQHLQAGQEQAGQNMLQLFGGPEANGPAGEAAAFTDINRGELAQLASAQQAYDTNLVPTIGVQGANAQQGVMSAAQAQIGDLQAQMMDLEAQRGSARTEAVYNLRQQRLQNEAAQQSLELARSLAPSQVAEARANATKARVEAAWAPRVAQQQAKQFGMNMKTARSNLTAIQLRNKKLMADLAGDDGTLDLSTPDTRSQLVSSLRSTIQTKNGTWLLHPGAAQQNMSIALKQLGLGNNPQARAIANSLLQETVNNSLSRGMWTQFRWENGKIVKRGRTAAGKRNYKQQQANKKK